MTDTPKKQPPEEKLPDSGCLSMILFWGGVIAFFGFAGWIGSFFPRSDKVGETIGLAGVLLGILGVILYGMGSSSIKGTAKNFITLVKWFAALLFIGWLLPTSCSHNDSSSSIENTYYRE